MKKKSCFLILFLILHFYYSVAGAVERPEIWGVAKMTFWVNDFSSAREYYGGYLGFEETFTYESDWGQVISFKINDRQFIEFVENKNIKNASSLICVSFDCDKIGQMENYLKSHDVEIKTPTTIDAAGNEKLVFKSTEDYNIEFIRFTPNGLHKSTTGKFLGKNRIANRIHHAGLFVSDVDKANSLFVEILGFKEMWRFKEDDSAVDNYIYLHPATCIENIEYVVNGNKNSSHPCFSVPEMQQTIYQLKERNKPFELANPGIGNGKRWLLNISNGNGIRVEFTEPYTVR